ncbi:TldD/PmbA family protein [Candidatus Woesearchaeota archaeon]|nr:TldD/PmbA family protein [Candidatus Woesearchaeota archaeon]
MQNFIRYAEKKGADYVELKSSVSTRTSFELKDTVIRELSQGSGTMYCARVFVKGKEGLAYSTEEDYKSLIGQALKNLKLVQKTAPVASLPQLKKRFVTPIQKKPADVGLEEKRDTLLRLAKLGLKTAQSVHLGYMENSRNYSYFNSESRDLQWNDVRSTFRVQAFCHVGSKTETFLDTLGGHQGFEILDVASDLVKNTSAIAKQLLKAKAPIGGNFPVVVDSHLGGVFCHESVGHACEADAVLQGTSVMKGKLNTLVGSEAVTIIDDGLQASHGLTLFDDEGVLGHSTHLVEKGILHAYLQNRETAALLRMEPTGNGRAQSLADKPIPRMTCTYVAPGDSSFDEIVGSIQEGYYLKGTLGGQVNPSSGEFLFNAQYGYFIKKGEVKQIVNAASLTGNILQTLFDIHLVAKDLQFNAGMCGKEGQWAPVGDGSPHFKIDKARVGGL